jgi:hypothetical protein
LLASEQAKQEQKEAARFAHVVELKKQLSNVQSNHAFKAILTQVADKVATAVLATMSGR